MEEGGRGMFRLLKCEYLKLKRSKFLLVGGLGTLIVPFFVILRGVMDASVKPGADFSLFSLYDSAIMFLMLLFAPLVLTVIGVWIINREYAEGTLKNILAIPVSRTAFLLGKLLFFAIFVLVFMLLSWLEVLVLAYVCSFFLPIEDLTILSALYFLVKMLYGGAMVFATQIPFLYLAVRTKNFFSPLIAVSAVSLFNVVLSNSPIAGFYPWSASYLLVCGRLQTKGSLKGISIAMILGMCLWGIWASIARIRKEE